MKYSEVIWLPSSAPVKSQNPPLYLSAQNLSLTSLSPLRKSLLPRPNLAGIVGTFLSPSTTGSLHSMQKLIVFFWGLFLKTLMHLGNLFASVPVVSGLFKITLVKLLMLFLSL